MKLSLDDNDASYVIRGYDEGIIRINETNYSQSLIISTEKIIPEWEPESLEQLDPTHINFLLQLSPQILILGTGSRLRFPDNAVFAQAYRQNIGIEVMDTKAACRTYNLIAAENRKVVAGLILDR